MTKDLKDAYRAFVVKRIHRGTPSGPGVTSAALFGRAACKKFDAIEVELEAIAIEMVKEGLVICTSGTWWVR